MGFESQKLRVWLISIGAIFVIYLLYNLISRTPSIEVDAGDTITESNTVESDGKVGRVGDVGVGTIQKAKYTHLNAKKQVDREFGFEKLLHEEGNEWEIEKPYMNVYRHNLKCYMTADKGTVRIEDAVGRPTPTDATLTGNVVIHILPEKGSNIAEGFIYLDDVIFISEKSQFSTAGPVKFTSKDAQLLGNGLEIVYNDELDHLEFLKIIELKTLRIRQSSKASLFSSEAATPSSASQSEETKASPGSSAFPPKTSEDKQTEWPTESTTAEDRQEAKEVPEMGSGAIEKKKGTYYKCVFRKNVVIDCPEQLVLADEVSIDNILWSKGPDKEYENEDANSTEKTETSIETVSVPEEKVSKKTEIDKENAASLQNEPNKFSEQVTDIVLTCDDGITVVPMDFSIMSPSPATDGKDLKSFNDEKGRPTFVAQKIDYCTVTENTVASGPSELTFYANDVMGTEGKPHPAEKSRGKQPGVPVKVTAQKKAEFLPALNQVIFEGNVLCTMFRENAGFQQRYALSAPKLTIYLSKDEQYRADIKHLTASGEVVQLDTSRRAGKELLGFTKLKCLQFDYDAGQQMFLATGSGVIAADNSKIAEPKRRTGKFSLRRPCYAVMRNFNTLKYWKETNLIIADAGAEQILIDYFPIIKGRQEQQTSATSNHIEAVLYETSRGQTELSTLSAKGGITYEEQRKKKGTTVQFVGSEMFYDGSKSMITAWGDKSQPCFLNGALAPGIEYNLKTGRIKTKIISPGMLQMGR